jgi:hypothetical protein
MRAALCCGEICLSRAASARGSPITLRNWGRARASATPSQPRLNIASRSVMPDQLMPHWNRAGSRISPIIAA